MLHGQKKCDKLKTYQPVGDTGESSTSLITAHLNIFAFLVIR